MSPGKLLLFLACFLAAVVGLLLEFGLPGQAAPPGHPAPPSPADVPAEPQAGPLRFREAVARVTTKATSLMHEVAFTNVGEVPFTIKGVRASCSCIAGKPANAVIGPNEGGSIPLQIELRGQSPGPKSYSVTVEYQDTQTREAHFTLVVDHRPDVQVVPAALTLALTAGKSARARFRVIDSRAEPFRFRAVESSPEGLDVSRAAVEDEPHGRHEFDVVVRDSERLAFGPTRFLVTVHAEGPMPQSWTVPVVVEKTPRIQASPTRLYLRKTSGGRIEGQVVVSDVEGEDVVLGGVEAPADKVKVTADLGARPRPVIKLEALDATSLKTPILIRIKVVSPCPQELTVTIAGLSSSP